MNTAAANGAHLLFNGCMQLQKGVTVLLLYMLGPIDFRAACMLYTEELSNSIQLFLAAG